MNEIIQKKLQRNIWKFYLFDIFGAMLFVVPIIVLFWQENGLSLTKVMVLQSIFSIAMVVLEVPTGYLADLYGRKNVLLLSALSLVAAISIYSIGFSFGAFLLGELCWALGMSFYSGTSSAFVYDTLKELNRESEYSKIWGKAKFYGFIAMALSQIIGGFVGKFNFRWTLYLSIPFYAFLIPVCLSLYEPKKHQLVTEKGHLHKLSAIFSFALLENAQLRWLIIFSAVIFALNTAGLWLYQPYLKLSGIDIAYFGLIFASFQIVTALSSKYAYKLESIFGRKVSLLVLAPIIFMGYLLLGKIVFLFSFLFIFLFQFVRGFSEPLFSDYVNKLTASEIRATVLSVQSLMQRLLHALIIPFIGWIADVYSLLQALTMVGIITFVVGIIILGILRKNKVV